MEKQTIKLPPTNHAGRGRDRDHNQLALAVTDHKMTLTKDQIADMKSILSRGDDFSLVRQWWTEALFAETQSNYYLALSNLVYLLDRDESLSEDVVRCLDEARKLLP